MTEPTAHSSTDRSSRSVRFFNRLHRYKSVVRRLWWVMPLTIALALWLPAIAPFASACNQTAPE